LAQAAQLVGTEARAPLRATMAARAPMRATMAAMQQVRLAVVGMPGHGKSTFLNALVGKRGEFEVGSGGGSCTQKVTKKELTLEHNGRAFRTILTDTMGFPDPNPEKAAGYYNSVIEECNQSYNAIVWLIRSERELHVLVSQYKVLMREFNNAVPPVIVVVNGLENYEDDDERKERKPKDLDEGYKFGQSIAKAAGVEVAKIIVGAEKADLKGKVKNELALSLLGTTPKTSSMKTFKVLQDEVAQCKSQADQVALEMQKREEAEAKIQQNITALRLHVQYLETWRAEISWIPFLGWIAEAALSSAIEGAQPKMGELEQALTEIQNEVSELRLDKDKMVRLFELGARQLQRLTKALFG